MTPNRADLSGLTRMEDYCARISCGVATGADEVFVIPRTQIEPSLLRFSHPTVSGRQLKAHSSALNDCSDVMLVPYDLSGKLIAEDELDCLIDFLSETHRKSKLLKRSCVRRKPWYAFHENPPLTDILQPKILCKDIAQSPQFWIDLTGEVIPRHSVYYFIPRNGVNLRWLYSVLSTPSTWKWLMNECQNAANGFIRMQSSNLKRIPIHEEHMIHGLKEFSIDAHAV
jgi:adenine-specific DNA-methyltransferase